MAKLELSLIFWDRRRYRHLRELGGNSNNGKNDMNGDNNKIGLWIAGMARMSTDSPSRQVT